MENNTDCWQRVENLELEIKDFLDMLDKKGFSVEDLKNQKLVWGQLTLVDIINVLKNELLPEFNRNLNCLPVKLASSYRQTQKKLLDLLDQFDQPVEN